MRALGSSKSTRVSGRRGSAAPVDAAGSVAAGADAAVAAAVGTGATGCGGGAADAGAGDDAAVVTAAGASPLAAVSGARGVNAQPTIKAANAPAMPQRSAASRRAIDGVTGGAWTTIDLGSVFVMHRAAGTASRAHCPVIASMHALPNSRGGAGPPAAYTGVAQCAVPVHARVAEAPRKPRVTRMHCSHNNARGWLVRPTPHQAARATTYRRRRRAPSQQA